MIFLHQALQALPYGISLLLAPFVSLQLAVSASDVHQANDLRQDLHYNDARDIGDLVAEGLGLARAEISSSGQGAESTGTILANVTDNGYNASTSIPSTDSVNSTISGPSTILVPSIRANGTINQYALSCYSARYSWRKQYAAWESTAIDGKSFSTTVTNTTIEFATTTTITIYPSDVPTYKLCDGSPRVDALPNTITSAYNLTSTLEGYVTFGTPTFSPAPCTMSPTDCMYLYYNTSLSWDDLTLLGTCGSPAHLGLPCLIGGGPVKLAYFPVSTTNGDLCRGNGSTITSMDGPSTIEALGTILTSGSVYLSFQTLYAYQEGFGIRIGPNFTDYILPVPSSAISTQCGGWFSAQGDGTAVNYADFNHPVPASAYSCANRCTTGLSYINVNGTGYKYTPPAECSTIWDDFNPALAVPTEARNLVPEWSTCSFWDAALPNFLFDPPIALRPATAIAIATLPVSESQQTTPASPASTSYTALTETNSAIPTTTSSAESSGQNQSEIISATLPASESQKPIPASPASTSHTALAETDSAMPTTTTSAESSGQSQSETTGTSTVPAQGATGGVAITFSAGGKLFTASAPTGAAAHSAIVVDGITVAIGGSAQVVEGHTVSLDLGGILVDGTSAAIIHSTSLGEAVTTLAQATGNSGDGSGGSSISGDGNTSGGDDASDSSSVTRPSSGHGRSTRSTASATSVFISGVSGSSRSSSGGDGSPQSDGASDSSSVTRSSSGHGSTTQSTASANSGNGRSSTSEDGNTSEGDSSPQRDGAPESSSTTRSSSGHGSTTRSTAATTSGSTSGISGSSRSSSASAPTKTGAAVSSGVNYASWMLTPFMAVLAML